MPIDHTPKAVQDCHDLLRWLIPHLQKFPKAHKFTLAERIESAMLDVLEALVAAAYSRDKRADLALANRRLNVSRHLWRLAFELRLIAHQSYAHGSQRLVELVSWNNLLLAYRKARLGKRSSPAVA